MKRKLLLQLYSAAGPGVQSLLLHTEEAAVNVWPDVLHWNGKTFILSPSNGEYREVTPYYCKK